METYSFHLELPSDTSIADAYIAGETYLKNKLNLQPYADYALHGSVIIREKPGLSRFNYSYKA